MGRWHNSRETPIGSMILAIMQGVRMNQIEFADAIGVSRPMINQIINGVKRLTIMTALKIEERFGVEAEELMKIQAVWHVHLARLKREKNVAPPIDTE